MENFGVYLLSKRIVPEKKLVYYLAWVIQFYPFCDKSPGKDVSVELKGRLVTSKETIRRFQLESASNVSKSLRALFSKGILRREKRFTFSRMCYSPDGSKKLIDKKLDFPAAFSRINLP